MTETEAEGDWDGRDERLIISESNGHTDRKKEEKEEMQRVMYCK